MSNKFKDIDIKNHTNFFFDDIINIKNLDPNNITMMKIHTKIFLFTTLDKWRWKIKYVKINSLNPLYLIINKVDGLWRN